MDAQPTESAVELRDAPIPSDPPSSEEGEAQPSDASAKTGYPRRANNGLSLPYERVMAWYYHMPTGRKLFIAILIALAPLALITFIANVRSAQSADEERLALISGANRDIARRIASTLVTDEDIVRRPLESFRLAPATKEESGSVGASQAQAPATNVQAIPPLVATRGDFQTLCQDIARALSTNKSAAPELHLLDARSGEHLCHETTSDSDAVLSSLPRGKSHLEISEDLKSIIDIVPITDGNGTPLVAMLVYPWTMLEELSKPNTELPAYNLYLTQGEKQIDVTTQVGVWVPGNSLSATSPVGRTGTTLEIAARRKSVSGTDIISLIAPLGMWLLAGGLAWLLVNKLLLRPLRDIQHTVAYYRPGQRYRAQPRGPGVATEISSLEQDMTKLSEMVACDKRDLASGLERQTLLTREVHHRVKNNLQIIASLLNIHSRAADTVEAMETYRSIQRRVGALSAVHRNHFAELEDNEGIALRPLLSELAAGLKGNTPMDALAAVTVDAAAMQIQQDIAVPVSFLFTEIGELALLSDPAQTLNISAWRVEGEENIAELVIQSDALKAGAKVTDLLHHRFDRVLTGLSRQLRQTLDYDGDSGTYRIHFPILD